MFSNMINWLPCDMFTPVEAGTYLVTTVGGYIRLDRWDGEYWGLCKPRHEIPRRNQGRYKPHKAFAYLPRPYEK